MTWTIVHFAGVSGWVVGAGKDPVGAGNEHSKWVLWHSWPGQIPLGPGWEGDWQAKGCFPGHPNTA